MKYTRPPQPLLALPSTLPSYLLPVPPILYLHTFLTTCILGVFPSVLGQASVGSASTFTNNYAELSGGVATVEGGASLSVSGTAISGSAAGFGGGVFAVQVRWELSGERREYHAVYAHICWPSLLPHERAVEAFNVRPPIPAPSALLLLQGTASLSLLTTTVINSSAFLGGFLGLSRAVQSADPADALQGVTLQGVTLQDVTATGGGLFAVIDANTVFRVRAATALHGMK